MSAPDRIRQTRYRALRAGLVLVGLSSLGGAAIVYSLPQALALEWMVFVAVGVVMLAMVPLAARARARGDRAALERLAKFMIGVATLLVFQRLAFSMYGPLIHDETRYLFRPLYAFLPFLYLASITVLRARVALRVCWLTWLCALALTVPALAIHTGFSFEREGMTTLAVWLLLANPLFIMMMRALPSYEEQLEESVAEVAQITDLMAQLAESERRFNLVVEGLEVGVWDRWVGPPQRRWWSPRFFELIGYAPGEIEPTEETLKGMLHPDDRERVWKAGTEQLARGDLMDVDFRFNTKHRGYRWFNSRAHAERDASGRLVRLAGSLTDIHDRRVAEDALHVAQAELTRLAYRDTLTDLYNRRYFDEHFQREWERARRSRQPLSLLLVDLDYFKAYNDRYGHPAGDSCLVEFSHLLTRCASRPADIVARLGGEEFGLVLPETSALRATRVAQRLQLLLQENAIPHEGSPGGVLTFSAGVAAIETPEGPGPAELFEQADRALYEIKRRGRNGILRYEELAPGEAMFAGNKAR